LAEAESDLSAHQKRLSEIDAEVSFALPRDGKSKLGWRFGI